MEKFEVDFFRRNDGTCPVEDFLSTLDEKMMAKVIMIAKLLEKNGSYLREPYSKPLVDGIFEIRAQQGNNITRVLYFFYVGKKIILTNGFTKKTQKTPMSEIAVAKKYRAEYLERKENGNE